MITASTRTTWLTQVVLAPASSGGWIQGRAVGNGEGRLDIRGLPRRQDWVEISLNHGRSSSVSGTPLPGSGTRVAKMPEPLDIAVIGLA
jgi:hypothetical protein